MEQPILIDFHQAIQAIKNAILQSRYRAATLVNRELLSLYFGIGKFISENSRTRFWGTNAIETISVKLQQELPGLRGFSPVNIKRMRQFYEEWEKYFQTSGNQNNAIRPQTTDEIQTDLLLTNRPSVTDDLAKLNFEHFLAIGFTHHYEILIKTKTVEERLFYVNSCAKEFWSVEKLKYNLKISLFQKQGSMPNNFEKTIQNANLQKQALQSFKDEYLLDFINIEDPDELDERLLETEIVLHVKKFIMALGSDFSFLGNQYRLEVDEKEFFIDLLFFNRRIQCLVAIELKRGEFKPEYAGKLNFYLSALDEYIKLPHENPSIGIILCKSKSKKIVEFAFRDTSKPMGVATYQLATQPPEQYRDVLPDAETLKKLL
ncbi:MAG: PDDEXK nuclease domain-containing protein [Bacilli bacterium]|jgi:predicted nuclease of restriction endonuclease-like (RecB) superfamily